MFAADVDPDAAVVGRDELEGEPLLGALHLGGVEGPADEALDRVDGVLCVDEASLAGEVARDDLAIGQKGNHGGDELLAVEIRQHLGAVSVGDSDHRIGRAEVDAEDDVPAHEGRV